MDIPKAGDIAPDVALPDENGTIHRLSDQRGRWVVLYFYPEDDTPGCTKEACSFRDANETILTENAVVWGVSPDDAKSKASFRSKYSLPFTLLSDVDHDVTSRYGSWIERVKDGQTQMRTARRTFLIDPEGRLARVWETVTPEGHAEEVLTALREAKSAPVH
jgi:peroxiredoxin Q/BCP